MTAKLIALYKPPTNAKEFDSKYFDEHIPLVQKIPGLQLIEISKVKGAPSGDAAYHLMAELYFDNLDAVKAGLASPEGREATNNIMSFAGDLVTMMFAEVSDNN